MRCVIGATTILDGVCARRPCGGRSGRRNGVWSNQETSGSAGLRERGRGNGRRTLMVPRDAACHDGIDENKQLSGTGDERALVPLSGGDQPFVKGNELWIPAEGCRQGGGIKRAAQPFAPAVDVTDANMLT